MWISKIEVTYTGTPIIGPDGQEETSLSFESAEVTAYLDDAEGFTPPSLIKNPSSISNIVFSSSNTSVATVDSQTGAITLNAEGETTITASCSETDEHTAATANYLLTVKANKPVTTEVAIVAQIGGNWYVATTPLNNNKLNATAVSVQNGQVVYSGKEDIVWLWNEKEGTLTNSNGDVLSAKSSSDTYLSYNGTNKTWTINDSHGLVNTASSERAILAYYSGSIIFGYYAISNIGKSNYSSKAQLLPIVSEITPETEEVTTNSLGWATFAPSKNVEMTKQEDVSVYYIKNNRADEKYAYVSDAKQVITEGTAMAAGTGVLIKAEAGTVVQFSVNETCPNVIDASSMNNALVGVTAEEGLAYDASRTNAYIFTKNNEGKIGFYKWGSGTLAKGKCYLQLSPSAAQAPQFLVLSEDRVTSIADAFGAEPLKTQESTYNLSGQKVNGAYKGIIIRNNKKYVKK